MILEACKGRRGILAATGKPHQGVKRVVMEGIPMAYCGE
jgi:hypothetical protein